MFDIHYSIIWIVYENEDKYLLVDEWLNGKKKTIYGAHIMAWQAYSSPLFQALHMGGHQFKPCFHFPNSSLLLCLE